MKRKFILLIMLMCALGGVKSSLLNAQDVTIPRDPNISIAEDNHFIDTYNKTSISQQYYTSDELSVTTGKITDIAFYTSNVYTKNTTDTYSGSITRNIQIYLKEDDSNSSFTINKTIVLDATNDKYYEGEVTLVENSTIKIKLSEPFNYNGKNLIVCVNDITGAWTDYRVNYKTFTGNNRVVYNAGSSTPYNVTKIISGNDNGISSKVPQIQFTFSSVGTATPTAPTLTSPTIDDMSNVSLNWSYGADNPATHYQVLFGTDTENLSAITEGTDDWFEREVLGTGGLATTGSISVANLIGYNQTYYWKVNVKNGEEGEIVGSTVSSFTTPESNFVFSNTGNWNEAKNWEDEKVPSNGANITLNAAATITANDVISVNNLTFGENGSLIVNGSLTITGTFTNTDASKLIINDGGQIFQTNADVQATFNMNIIAPEGEWNENNTSGWQLISSPFTDAAISNFTTIEESNEYDFYKYDGAWVNIKDENNTGTNEFETSFVSTRGYLASYKAASTASITGTLNPATMLYLDKNGEYGDKITITVNGNYLENFFLIGNPFPFDMNMSKMSLNDYIVKGYAILDATGSSFTYSSLSGTVKAGDAFLIKTNGIDSNSNPHLYYEHNSSSKSRSEEAASINFIATSENGSDNLIISLSGAENEGFNKLENFNKDIATVFVVKNDTRYGIANFDNDVTMIDVAFEAPQMGNYTISAQPNGKFKTLTLLDRFTGIETDLLVEDYHFTATSNDNYNRFIVKLVNGQQTTDNSHFAYVSGEELILSEEGAVEIIDMMGRIIYANDIIGDNNRINVSAFNNAAYVVRVINENGVKVQKIIL